MCYYNRYSYDRPFLLQLVNKNIQLVKSFLRNQMNQILLVKQNRKTMQTIVSTLIIISGLILGSITASGQQYFKVKVEGKGTPAILIHGMYCTSDVWEETVARYRDKYEMHLVTLAGFGGVSPNLSENFLQNVKNELIEYVKSNQLKKPLLIGHSMGGFLSYWAASSAPELFSAVIAVDGLPYFPALQMPGITAESAKQMASNMRNMISSQNEEQTRMSQSMYLPTMIRDKKYIDLVAEMASKSDAKTIGQAMYEMYTVDLRDMVSNIACPVLVLGSWIAYKDYGVSRESTLRGYEAQVVNIKNSTVHLSDTAKHFIFYDEPEWFYQTIDSFLNENKKL